MSIFSRIKQYLRRRRQADVAAALLQLAEKVEAMTEQVDRVATEVAETKVVIEALKGKVTELVVANATLAQQIRDAVADPLALEAIATDLDNTQTDVNAFLAALNPAPVEQPAEEQPQA